MVQLGTKADFDVCFQSVSEGKSLIADAVTGKGVTTASDATFQTIADNIEAISQLDTSDANATASQILSGYTAYVKGSKVAGSMVNRGAVTSSLNCGNSYTIPEGYHNGSGKVAANSLASQTSATAVAADILTGKTAYVNGTRLTGTMVNRGTVSQALNCGGSYTIPAGYHNGSGKITANSLSSQTSATATAAQILSGYTAWVNGVRLTGTLQAGIPFQSASVDQVGNSGAIYIPENVTKFYFFHGSGLYWSWHRCDDASTSNMVMIASSRGWELHKSSYDPSRRIIVLEAGDEDEGMGVIGWQ